MRNKKLKKAILTSLSIFTFTGIILSASMDSVLKSQVSSSSENFLNDGNINYMNEKSEFDSQLNDSMGEKSTRATTTIDIDRSDSTIQSFIATTYPFQFLNNRAFLERLVKIDNTPPGFVLANDASFSISGINNIGQKSSSPLNSGVGTIQVTVNRYFDEDGSLIVYPTTPGSVALTRSFIINNFKSVANQTIYSPVPPGLFPIGSTYASDITEDNVDNVFEVLNGVQNLSPSQDTKLNIKNISFDNKIGKLIVRYTLINYFDQSGQYITREMNPVQEIELNGFKIVPGVTTFGLKPGIVGNTLIPSTIARELESDFKNFKKWFELTNLPDNSDQDSISAIKDIVPSDKDGTIQLTYTIIGDYFDDNLIKQSTSQQGQDFTVVVSGLNSQVEGVDIVPIVIGASVGGVVLIAAIVLTIFFVSKAKKKKSEELRKQKLSSKVSPPTDIAKSSSFPSSPTAPKSPVPPSGPVNRPVPPPIKK